MFLLKVINLKSGTAAIFLPTLNLLRRELWCFYRVSKENEKKHPFTCLHRKWADIGERNAKQSIICLNTFPSNLPTRCTRSVWWPFSLHCQGRQGRTNHDALCVCHVGESNGLQKYFEARNTVFPITPRCQPLSEFKGSVTVRGKMTFVHSSHICL